MTDEEYPDHYNREAWGDLPDYDPESGHMLNRFGMRLYERTPYDVGDVTYLWKDVPDEVILADVGRDYIDWQGKLTLVSDLHSDIRIAVRMAKDSPRVPHWSNQWWALRHRDRKADQKANGAASNDAV